MDNLSQMKYFSHYVTPFNLYVYNINNYKTHKFTVHYKQLIQICKEIKILQHYLVIIYLFLDKKKLLTGVYLVIYYLVSKFLGEFSRNEEYQFINAKTYHNCPGVPNG